MDQARKELDSHHYDQDQNSKKPSARKCLQYRKLSAMRYIYIAKIPPEKTYSIMMQFSKSKITEIKGTMEELKDKFCHDKKFRKKAKKFNRIEHFKTKKRFFVNGRNYYAMEKLADHIIECAELAICTKSAHEANIAYKIRSLYEFLSDTIVSKSALLAGSRVISFITSFLRNILDDPLALGKNLLLGMGRQIVEVFKLLEWEVKINNPIQNFGQPRKKNESLTAYRQRALYHIAHKMCSTSDGLMGKINSFVRLMGTNPRQAVIEIFATAMEFALLDLILKSGVANYKASQFVKPAVDSMRSGLSKVSKNISLTGALQNIRRGLYPPTKGLGNETALVACAELGEISAFLIENAKNKTIQRGNIINTLDIIEKNPDIVVGKKTLAEVFKECVSLSTAEHKAFIARSQLTSHLGIRDALNCLELLNQSKYWSISRLKHIVLGDLSAKNAYKLYGGLHTWGGFERFLELSGMDIGEFIIKDLGNGVTGIHFPEKAFVQKKFWSNARVTDQAAKTRKGVKTLWPKHFAVNDIIRETSDIVAKASPSNITNKSFTGKTQNGLSIKIRLDKNNKILSAFPEYHQ